MSIDTRTCRIKPTGFGTWTFRCGRMEVVYTGWFGEARTYLAETYGNGSWQVAA